MKTPKSDLRNPNGNLKKHGTFLPLRISSFGFRSDFGFGISDLESLKP